MMILRVGRLFRPRQWRPGAYTPILVVAILIGLASCGGKPVAINASEVGIVVRYSWSDSPEAATAMAQANCAKYGRNAVLQSIDNGGSVFASYYCVKPGTAGL